MNVNRANTTKLLAAYFLYECGRAMYFVLITWFLFKWTQDAIYTGLFVSFGFIPGLLSNLVFGVLVDRYNRKRLANLAGAISFVVLLLLMATAITGYISPWTIIAAHMMMQTAGSLYRPSLQALTAEVFDKETLPRIFSLSSSATISGGLAGAAIGGILSGMVPISGSLGVVLSLYGAAWTAVWRLHYERNSQLSPSKSLNIIGELKDGFNYLSLHPMLYGLFAMMMLGQLTFHTTIGFLSVYTSEYLHQNSVTYGLLDACFSAGGILAGILGTWWWYKCKNRLAVWSLTAMAAGLFLLGCTQHLLFVFIGVLGVGLGTSWIRALLQSIQQMSTDKEYHGRMSSFRMLSNQASVVISGPIFGVIAASRGANEVFLFLLVPVALGIIWAVFQSNDPAFVKITNNKTA
ncbi:MFS transporter [Halobacillus rhizosphaerae]|uniref:MFS transporter n=1 Tax=Halobacillus rhizosphaerae TaxID=3064889 RepID=UPI00398B7C20